MIKWGRVYVFFILTGAFLIPLQGNSGLVSVKEFLQLDKCGEVTNSVYLKRFVCAGHSISFINSANFIGIDNQVIYTSAPVYCTKEDCFIPYHVAENLRALLQGKKITILKNQKKTTLLKYEVSPFFNFYPREEFIRKVAAHSGIILIDPGHGGEDSGAISPSGLKEKDLVLDIALRLQRKLQSKGFKTLLTRTKDIYVPLEERSRISMQATPDLFLSIHANYASNSEARGVEIYYAGFFASDVQAERVAEIENTGKKINPQVMRIVADLILWRQLELSLRYAKIFHYFFSRYSKTPSRGARKGPFWILLSAGAPSILLEVGFLSNRKEEKLLRSKEYKEELVDVIMMAIVNSLQLKETWKNGFLR